MIIDLELTWVCNATCTFCPRDELARHARFLDMRVVRRMASELRGARIYLSGIGESILHPNIEEIVSLFAASDCEVYLNSNGTSLTADGIRSLVSAGLAGLHVSLNAATSETRNKVMGLNDLDQVRETLEEIFLLRNRSTHFVIKVSMVICRDNSHEVESFVDFWLETPVDSIMLHPLNERAGLLEEGQKAMDVRRWQQRYEPHLRVEFDVVGEAQPEQEVCNVAAKLDFVTSDGDLLLCAMDHRGDYRFGNLAQTGFAAARKEKIAAYLRGDTLVRCLQCEFFPKKGLSVAGDGDG
ncbi:MAG: radical SAM protein [Gammaproteobacteria bacterium]|jgi:MoaA/NifB/PqqE/SkfB family radical SAM enzyme|nr:radical SAM protein [Gammaproteobacteria bacterium]